MDKITVAQYYIVKTIFDGYLIILLLRLYLQMVRVSFYNPISQLIVKLTDPLVLPLRRFLPRVRLIDLSIVVLVILLDAIKFLLLLSIIGQFSFGIIILVILNLIHLNLNLFFYAILIMAVMSWLSPGQYNPVGDILYPLTEPVLKPFRQVIPVISGFDLSPLAAMVVLQVLMIFFQ